jgi:hypothetical protein
MNELAAIPTCTWLLTQHSYTIPKQYVQPDSHPSIASLPESNKSLSVQTVKFSCGLQAVDAGGSSQLVDLLKVIERPHCAWNHEPIVLGQTATR